MRPKQIAISVSLLHNSSSKRSSFSGFAYLDAGFLIGRFSGQDRFELNEATLLSAFTLTGCPLAARTSNPDLNPWIATNGEYRGHRNLEMSCFSANSIIQSTCSNDRIEMMLDVEYEGALPDLVAIVEPFQEEISQLRCGELFGNFSLIFRDGSDRKFGARATTNYFLPINFDVGKMWRNITILGLQDATTFNQIEQIDLFGNAAEATLDLESKLQVTCNEQDTTAEISTTPGHMSQR